MTHWGRLVIVDSVLVTMEVVSSTGETPQRYTVDSSFLANLPPASSSMTSFGSSLNVQGKKLVCVLAAITIVLIGRLSGNGYPVIRGGTSTVEEEEGKSVMKLSPVLVVEGRHVVEPMTHTILRGIDDTITSELFAPSIYGMMFPKELEESRNMVLASEEEEEGSEDEDSEPIQLHFP